MKKARYKTCSFVTIKPSYFVTYSRQFEEVPSEKGYGTELIAKARRGRTHEWRRDNTHKGIMSAIAQSKARNTCNFLQLGAKSKNYWCKKELKWKKYKIAFACLTLPGKQMHSDSYLVSHMLIPFLKRMQRANLMHSYIWKAEPQDNDNLHFHICTDSYCAWKTVAKQWDSLCFLHGYYKSPGNIPTPLKSASTYIRPALSDKAVSSYVAKYISKNDNYKTTIIEKYKALSQEDYVLLGLPNAMAELKALLKKRTVTCRLWGCSHNLTKHTLTVNTSIINTGNNDIEHLKKRSNKAIHKEFYSVFMFKKNAHDTDDFSFISDYYQLILAAKICEHGQQQLYLPDENTT
jgi:hypothetical protein